MFAFEGRHQKIAPLRVFFLRLASSVGLATLMLAVVLLIGIAGYHWLGGLDWIDSLLEAAMILSGMGPVNPLTTNRAKVFASAYALFSGVFFIAVIGVIISPILHRMMHKFHLDTNTKD